MKCKAILNSATQLGMTSAAYRRDTGTVSGAPLDAVSIFVSWLLLHVWQLDARDALSKGFLVLLHNNTASLQVNALPFAWAHRATRIYALQPAQARMGCRSLQTPPYNELQAYLATSLTSLIGTSCWSIHCSALHDFLQNRVVGSKTDIAQGTLLRDVPGKQTPVPCRPMMGTVLEPVL